MQEEQKQLKTENGGLKRKLADKFGKEGGNAEVATNQQSEEDDVSVLARLVRDNEKPIGRDSV